jgi:hypothetical protein
MSKKGKAIDRKPMGVCPGLVVQIKHGLKTSSTGEELLEDGEVH